VLSTLIPRMVAPAASNSLRRASSAGIALVHPGDQSKG